MAADALAPWGGYSVRKLLGVCRGPLKIGPKKIEGKMVFWGQKDRILRVFVPKRSFLCWWMRKNTPKRSCSILPKWKKGVKTAAHMYHPSHREYPPGPGSLRRQDISSHDIDYIEYVGPSLIWGKILSTCVKSMWRNDIKCKYMFMFPQKNLARKGLIKQDWWHGTGHVSFFRLSAGAPFTNMGIDK